MVYEMFLETVKQQLQQDLGEGYLLDIHPIPKNNGVTLDGLSVFAPGSHAAPVIYLAPYYEQLQRNHMSMEEICTDIKQLCRSASLPDCFLPSRLSDFESVRSKVMMKLIHTASNTELLSQIPHIPYLDLSIVFYLFLEQNESGQMTILIHLDHMHKWNTSERGLLRLAAQNTPALAPARIRNMTDILHDIARKNAGEQYDAAALDLFLQEEAVCEPLFVLTNETGIYGAVCILYRNVLKNFADKLGKDLIIIPSSVHEVLLLPFDKEVSYKELNNMVVTINQSEVLPMDQLSNHVYRYERSTDRISIALGDSEKPLQ